MARYWTSPNSCAYVNDDVYIKLALPQPVPEPQFDKLLKTIVEITRNYAVDMGGVCGRRYRVDDNELEYEDNPIAYVNGQAYVTYTGFIGVYCLCEDQMGAELEADLFAVIKPYNGKLIDYESHGDY